MTTVLTLPGLGGDVGGYMSEWLHGFAGGYDHVPVDYPAAAGTASIAAGVHQLQAAITQTLSVGGGPIVVLAHSQGAEVVSEWLEEYADSGPPPGSLRFILTGNPRRRLGGAGMGGWDWRPVGHTLETRYAVTDIARRWDGWANKDNYPGRAGRDWFKLWLGRFTVHSDYRDVTVAGCTVRETSGNTTYLIHP